jgi:ABC-type transport system involved in multi-copper enzyme maturation permease subunit
MLTIKTIAINTLKESIRNRIIANIFVFAFFLFILGVLIGNWSLGEQVKVITDIGLSALHLVALLIVIFVGVTLVSREIENRTIYNTLSKNLYRWQFLIGKFLGLSITLMVKIVLLTIILILLLYFYTGEIFIGLFGPVLMIYMEILIILSISIFFSTFNNATLSAIYTVLIFISGYLFQSVYEYLDSLILGKEETGLHVLNLILGVLAWVLPNLSLFNISTEYVHNVQVTPLYYGSTLGYGLLYLFLVLSMSIVIFNKKDLK